MILFLVFHNDHKIMNHIEFQALMSFFCPNKKTNVTQDVWLQLVMQNTLQSKPIVTFLPNRIGDRAREENMIC